MVNVYDTAPAVVDPPETGWGVPMHVNPTPLVITQLWDGSAATDTTATISTRHGR